MGLYTADSAGRLSSTSRGRTVDTGHSGDRDKERQIAGWEVVVATYYYLLHMDVWIWKRNEY